MTSCLVDTNILVRHIVGEPLDQARDSTAFLNSLGSGQITGSVPVTVLLEFVFTLERQYRATRSEVADALDRVLLLNGLTIENRLQLAEAIESYRERSNISFVDAYHCAMARSFHDGSIVSFDRKLSSVPGVNRMEPGEFVSV